MAALPPWHRTVTLRDEVREGRSFSPDEFAIALEQVVDGRAPKDYTDPSRFFARTCFTRALREHCGMVLRRLSGETANSAPVLSLVTQFGGGKTHTLTALYHLARTGPAAAAFDGVDGLLRAERLDEAPAARVGVFAGNAWDPALGRETPWIDLARQLAGDAGAAALGESAREAPPGTDALARVFAAAAGPVLLLFDEVLNFVNRHRDQADRFYSFIQNLTSAATGAGRTAVVISLPRNQVEMTDWDLGWQERINKVVNRVAQDLIVNDEAEISEVVRRRLFEGLGPERTRRKVARAYADWCIGRSGLLPPEWTAAGRDALRGRFEACYPFHPATLSVFQRKWGALPQFQQARATLAMLAQWVSWAAREDFRRAGRDPLITLGAAPLHDPAFRAAVLRQLGEDKLEAAINADLSPDGGRAAALDSEAGAEGALADIHRRTGAAILFESSGGQTSKVAHLPELRFALGGPDVETTSTDTSADNLAQRGFFVDRVGTDGYLIRHQATLRKAVNDRRAALDYESETRPAMLQLVGEEFRRGAVVPVIAFPDDIEAVGDHPRLTLVVADPRHEWDGPDCEVADRIGREIGDRGGQPRLYPGALVWCVRQTGHDLRNEVERWLAWRRVASEAEEGVLGTEYHQSGFAEIAASVRRAERDAREEVWASYRYVVLADRTKDRGLSVIDIGAGYANGGDSLCARVLEALRTRELLVPSVGASYLERKWPAAFASSGAWPLTSLRQSFLDGSLTRLADPDATLRSAIPRFVADGELGLASGAEDGSSYHRVWFREEIDADEVAFDRGVFLLTRDKARELSGAVGPLAVPGTDRRPDLDLRAQEPGELPFPPPVADPPSPPPVRRVRVRVEGTLPPEFWNIFGTRVLTALRTADGLSVSIGLSATADSALADSLRDALNTLGLAEQIRIVADEDE